VTGGVRGATPLSWSSGGKEPGHSLKSALARTWLCAVLPIMSSAGCLFPEPPEYQRSVTPPFLWSPDPPTTKVLKVNSQESQKFNVSVRSEDAPGDDLWGFLYLNYHITGSQELQPGIAVLRASTLSEERMIDMTWEVPARSTVGTCEPLSLVVSHRSNFVGYLPENPDDVALLTWWIDINDTALTLGQCPHIVGGDP
jgi:hypothetical protein